MRNGEHRQEHKSRFGGFACDYFDICETEYSAYLESLKRMEGTTEENERLTQEDVMFSNGVKAVVFGALSVEAGINDYAAWQLGDSYFDSHLKGLDVISKWVVIPELVCGRTIDKAGAAFSGLRVLVRGRNELVHNTSRRMRVSDPALPTVVEEHDERFHTYVGNSYRTLVLLSLELDTLLGPQFNPLRTFDRECNPMLQIPLTLQTCVAKCRAIAARQRS